MPGILLGIRRAKVFGSWDNSSIADFGDSHACMSVIVVQGFKLALGKNVSEVMQLGAADDRHLPRGRWPILGQVCTTRRPLYAVPI